MEHQNPDRGVGALRTSEADALGNVCAPHGYPKEYYSGSAPKQSVAEHGWTQPKLEAASANALLTIRLCQWF